MYSYVYVCMAILICTLYVVAARGCGGGGGGNIIQNMFGV